MKIYFWFIISIAAMTLLVALTGCGGTFTLRPDGSLSYTTKEIINVIPAK